MIPDAIEAIRLGGVVLGLVTKPLTRLPWIDPEKMLWDS
jgi:hypothetical protein